MNTHMKVSIPNANNVLPAGHTEIVAQDGRSYAAVAFAVAKDGIYRYSLHVMYSYGGFGGPIFADGDGFADMQAARNSALDDLLRRWPTAFASDPNSVHDELLRLKEQVEQRLQQPCLF